MEAETLASLNGLHVVYTGHQLIQSDLDVWENLAHLARLHPLGHECHFTAYGLLQLMGRHTGRSEHLWMHKSITRQVACAVEITDGRKTYCGSLIQSFRKDEMSGAYIVQLNPDLTKLFGDNEWTALDWKQRHAMMKQPLAQASASDMGTLAYFVMSFRMASISEERRNCGTMMPRLTSVRSALGPPFTCPSRKAASLRQASQV